MSASWETQVSSTLLCVYPEKASACLLFHLLCLQVVGAYAFRAHICAEGVAGCAVHAYASLRSLSCQLQQCCLLTTVFS